MRPEVNAYSTALRPWKDGEEERRWPVALDESVLKGHLEVSTSKPNAPPWKEFLDQGAVNPISGLSVAGASAALLFRASGRIFAATWGTAGRHMLNPDAIDNGFGLRVVLNSVDPDKLRTIDTANLETIGRSRVTQLARNSPVDNFGVDPVADLLRGLQGEPRDGRLAKKLQGSDALWLTAPMTLKDLPDKCKVLLEKSKETTYKKDFAWVDNLHLVRGSDDYNKLNDLLLNALNDSDDARVQLVPPETVDWTRLDKFRFTDEEPDTRHDELDLADFRLLHPDITMDHLRREEVVAYDRDGVEAARWPLYKTILAEIEGPDEASYVYLQGEWYRAAADFVESVNAAVRRIPVSKVSLGDCYHAEREDIYNSRICAESNGKYALLDKETIPYEGRSKVEPCDIFTDEKCFIHVKKGTRSATLSHLFLQGTVSAQAFRMDATYREKLREKLRAKLKKPHVALIPKEAPKPADYSICYAIATKPKVKVPLGLPFFSRVSLMQSHRTLDGLGYNVGVAAIRIRP